MSDIVCRDTVTRTVRLSKKSPAGDFFDSGRLSACGPRKVSFPRRSPENDWNFNLFAPQTQGTRARYAKRLFSEKDVLDEGRDFDKLTVTRTVAFAS